MAIEKVYLDPNAEANIGEEFTTAEQTKLATIEESADVNPANLAELDPTANTKLVGIEEGAQTDQTGAEIKTAYEAEVGAYTDAKDTKLTGIETDATKYPDVGEKAFSDAEQAKLAGVEESATTDQTGTEVKDAIIGLADNEREIIITRPITGQKKIYAMQTHTDGTTEIEQNDTPEA